MADEELLKRLVDEAVRDITRRMGKFDVAPSGAAAVEPAGSLVTTVSGDYRMTIAMMAGYRVLKAITEGMKRGTAEDRDIEAYTTEYFNVLCGHVVSRLNRSTHRSARFGIPRLRSGGDCGPPCGGAERLELYYDSSFGPLRVQVVYAPADRKDKEVITA